jgi:hypothetical protein
MEVCACGWVVGWVWRVVGTYVFFFSQWRITLAWKFCGIVFKRLKEALPLRGREGELPFQERLKELPFQERLKELPFQERLKELPFQERLKELPFQETEGSSPCTPSNRGRASFEPLLNRGRKGGREGERTEAHRLCKDT